MKKIMFDDKYGLTKAVLAGRKTMTRRSVPEKLIKAIEGGVPGFAVMESKYKVGEVVAVAQAYKHVFDEMMNGDYGDDRYDAFKNHYFGSGEGWHNKMFVKAEYMPHQIRITNVRVQKLQDISDEDCLKEGVFLGQFHTYSYVGRPRCPFGTPREAFASLMDRISGKGTWESNPWVFVYEFELVK